MPNRKFYFLKKTSDYKKVSRKGKTIKSFSLVALCCDRETISQPGLNQDYPVFGVTASKKIGNAVTRNLLKRRIKSICDEIADNPNLKNKVISFFCRKSTPSVNFQDLKKDVDKIIKNV